MFESINRSITLIVCSLGAHHLTFRGHGSWGRVIFFSPPKAGKFFVLLLRWVNFLFLALTVIKFFVLQKTSKPLGYKIVSPLCNEFLY